MLKANLVNYCQQTGGLDDVLVMRLIVFVPFVAGMHTIEISWFPRTILVLPVVRCRTDSFLEIK